MTVGGGRRALAIEAPGASYAEPYVHGLTLNGAPVTTTYLTSCQLRRGGVLDFSLGALPDKSWGTGAGAAPPSDSAPSPSVNACAARLAAGAGS